MSRLWAAFQLHGERRFGAAVDANLLQRAASLIDNGNAAALRDLLNLTVGLEQMTELRTGRSLLARAAARGSLSCVSVLLECGANIHACDTLARTPLHEAARFGHAEIVHTLLENGADPTKTDSLLNSPLHLAALNGDAPTLAVLAARPCGDDPRNFARESALHIACRHAGVEGVSILLNSLGDGVCLQEDKHGRSVLHAAAEAGNWRVVRLLLEARQGFNRKGTRDRAGRTPLMCAVQANDCNSAALLLSHGAVDCPNLIGVRPSLAAIFMGNVQMFDQFIMCGHDLYLADWLARHREGANQPNINNNAAAEAEAGQRANDVQAALHQDLRHDHNMADVLGLWIGGDDDAEDVAMAVAGQFANADADADADVAAPNVVRHYPMSDDDDSDSNGGSDNDWVDDADDDDADEEEEIDNRMEGVVHGEGRGDGNGNHPEYAYVPIGSVWQLVRQSDVVAADPTIVPELALGLPSLQQICRREVRKLLGRKRLSHIASLPLPASTQHYLVYNNQHIIRSFTAMASK
eukprot:m.10352 g.10352  ORF g.10352 m.10352 type:complete len:523 (+) comp5187_c0_seq1:40-1608(+)